MRAHNVTTITNRRRRARRRVIAAALGACALAIPASASAVPIDSGPYAPANATAGSQSGSVQLPHGADYSSVSGSPADKPTLVSGSPASAGDGFDWGDAAVGAGAAIALVLLGGAALVTVRRATAVSPTVSTG